jgi:murein DD-endopeptidase MepM/ murein hydrolase activator NlpD
MKKLIHGFFTKRSKLFVFIVPILLFVIGCNRPEQSPARVLVELNTGESRDVKLQNGDVVKLALLEIVEEVDSCRGAVRGAGVKIAVDGEEVILNTGNYNLPVTIGKVQIDCPVIKAYYATTNQDTWGLNKDAFFRLWPVGSSYLQAGTFVYPLKQEWLASCSQVGNEPTYVDWGEPLKTPVYYHNGFDFGAAEGMDEVFSATDGLVISSNKKTMDGYTDFPGDLRSDVVYILDSKGWCYRYSHLDSVLPVIKPGEYVKAGQQIGFTGKQGHSGGWVHLHFDISHKDTLSGKWINEDAYAYVWEAYNRQYHPSLIAVARPHHITWTGDPVKLDGSKSKSFTGEVVNHEWSFSDGSAATGAVQEKVYDKPGEYSEILKVTDSNGNVDYDFAVVQVYGKDSTEQTIPTIHAACYPTLDIQAGDPVVFLVRTFNSTTGREVWNYGDGSPQDTVQSETVDRSNPVIGEFAKTTHSFSTPGQYIVSVQRTNENGFMATARLHILVGGK